MMLPDKSLESTGCVPASLEPPVYLAVAPDSPVRKHRGSVKQHVTLGLLRFILGIGVLIALPFSHTKWGASYPGDGQQAFGFIVIFAVIGFVAALIFFAVGSVVQFLLRRRPPQFTILADVVLFLVFVGVLVYGGATAKYGDTPPKHSETGDLVAL